MSKYYYRKSKFGLKKLSKIVSIIVLFFGLSIAFYVFLPLFSWQVYFAPVFAQQQLTSPIPKTTIVNQSTLTSLLSQASSLFSGVDYTNAENWYPQIKFQKENQKIARYTLSIPEIGIKDAEVSTTNSDLSKHLVNHGGTSVPPEKGNTVIFGHSTLPQLYDPKDYKTVFTNLYKLKQGDKIFVNIAQITYEYKIINITVVEAKDTSVFEQNFSDSFLSLVTCTPPGTTWKRLIIKAKLEKI